MPVCPLPSFLCFLLSHALDALGSSLALFRLFLSRVFVLSHFLFPLSSFSFTSASPSFSSPPPFIRSHIHIRAHKRTNCAARVRSPCLLRTRERCRTPAAGESAPWRPAAPAAPAAASARGSQRAPLRGRRPLCQEKGRPGGKERWEAGVTVNFDLKAHAHTPFLFSFSLSLAAV